MHAFAALQITSALACVSEIVVLCCAFRCYGDLVKGWGSAGMWTFLDLDNMLVQSIPSVELLCPVLHKDVGLGFDIDCGCKLWVTDSVVLRDMWLVDLGMP